MRKIHNKLVRDRIPEIIRAVDKQYETEVLSEEEYRQALRQKLVEEANEAALAASDDLIKELADVYEVIDGLMTFYQIDQGAVTQAQKE